MVAVVDGAHNFLRQAVTEEDVGVVGHGTGNRRQGAAVQPSEAFLRHHLAEAVDHAGVLGLATHTENQHVNKAHMRHPRRRAVWTPDARSAQFGPAAWS